LFDVNLVRVKETSSIWFCFLEAAGAHSSKATDSHSIEKHVFGLKNALLFAPIGLFWSFFHSVGKKTALLCCVVHLACLKSISQQRPNDWLIECCNAMLRAEHASTDLVCCLLIACFGYTSQTRNAEQTTRRVVTALRIIQDDTSRWIETHATSLALNTELKTKAKRKVDDKGWSIHTKSFFNSLPEDKTRI
jgi:hypothetical protein